MTVEPLSSKSRFSLHIANNIYKKSSENEMVSGNIPVRIVETSLVINSRPCNTYTNDIESTESISHRNN